MDLTLRHWIKGSKLGAGSYGNVFLGLNSKNGMLMAVKQVPYIQDLSDSETAVAIEDESNTEERLCI